jgi:hypothetical protein
MRITTLLLILPFLFLSSSSGAAPFQMDTYDDNFQQTDIGLTYSKLNQLASKCLIDKGWLDMDVDLKSGISSRQRGFTESQDTFIGLVTTVPLFSGKELDRERDKLIARKRTATDDISGMIEHIQKVLHNRRMIEIYKILESRSKRRVQAGVVTLTEQVDLMEKLSNLKKENITFTAQVGGRYTALLNGCKDGKDKRYLQDYMDEELDKLKIKF